MPAGNNESGRPWWMRAGSEAIDRLFLNNRGYDYQSGYWNGKGALQGGLQTLANSVVPGAGLAVGAGLNIYNQGQPGTPSLYGMYLGGGQQYGSGFPSGAGGTDMGYATIPNYGGYAPSTGGNAQIGGIQREQFPMNTSTTAPGMNYGYTPTLPPVFANAGNNGPIGGFANGIFNGGAGNFGQNSAPPTTAQIAGGSRGTATQGHQWTGLSGDAARSYFGGLSTGSTDALQHAEMMAMAKQRQ